MSSGDVAGSDPRDVLPAGLRDVPVIGIARRLSLAQIAQIAEAVVEGGLRAIEVTLDTPGAHEQIRLLVERCPGVLVGAGSVLTAEAVRGAADAGARFVVAPTTDPVVIETAGSLGLASFPGAATPTEIRAAVVAGATAVKVFPAHLLGGPAFIAAVRAPLHEPPLVPTGGIEPSAVRDYLAAGAVAVGAGSSLFSADRHESVEQLVARVRTWVEVTP
jgi:2-dehydro-3-deoxyphosphogluconate aldolase/(4S)-4-hydroxy-2-oxoglutarate aldolase